jgi:hypothetical protein
MRPEWRWMGWRPVLGIIGAAVWLGLAACGGIVVPPAPQVPQAPQAPNAPDTSGVDTSGAWEALSQNSRLAQSSPTGAGAPAAPESMSPDEARLAAPFAFGVPAWTPPGFQLQAQAEVIVPASNDGLASVNLNWQNAQGAAIEFSVSQGAAGSALAGAGGDSQSLQINGQPARLRHQTGLGADRLVLSWTRGALAYRLTADAGAATGDDLVHMAASVS